MRKLLVPVVVASLASLAVAGRSRPRYDHIIIDDEGTYHAVAYCVAAPASGRCKAKVTPPWVPTGVRGKRSIGRDEDASTAYGECCYAAAWGRRPQVEKPKETPCTDKTPCGCGKRCDPPPEGIGDGAP